MDALQAIFSRRSIRKHTAQPISREQEQILLKAAMCAPNTINKRNWAFVVVRDPGTLNKLSGCLSPNAPDLKDAPMAIVVCGDLSLTVPGLEGYWVQDCAAAAANILLAAHAIGLGGVWYGIYSQDHKVKQVTELFQFPEHIVPMCAIGLGYPGETKADESDLRYEEHKVHREAWRGRWDVNQPII